MDGARAGLGVALLPDFLVADDLASGRLVRLVDGWAERGHAIWAIYPHSRHLAPKVRLFVDHLASSLSTCRAHASMASAVSSTLPRLRCAQGSAARPAATLA